MTAVAARTALNLIGGRSVAAADRAVYQKRNPARPDEVVAEVARSGRADAEAAVAAASEAFPRWAATPAPRRADVLTAAAAAVDARADEIAADMTREMGKPLREARGEVGRVAAILRFYAGEAYRPIGEVYEQSAAGRIVTVRRPLGVVASITPWNFPAAIPAWKAAPALVYGNTVVLKAAQEAPLTALALASCFMEAGLPPGVLNVVLGPGSTAGAALVQDTRVSAISFTGSVETGTAIRDRATSLGTRVQCELGGQNPLVVAADADLDRAAEAAYAGAFWSAGQKCTATRRIYVERSAYDAFRERFLARVATGKVGDPAAPDTEVGPLVSRGQLDSVVAAIERGRSEGGRVLAGGTHRKDGFFVDPTVFEDVAEDAALSCDEVFGPVVSLYAYDTLEEALRRANAVAMGLSASIFTSSIATAERFSRGLEAGILHVNAQTAGAEVHVPFGGVKASGWGPHEQGRSARDFYTDVITIYENV